MKTPRIKPPKIFIEGAIYYISSRGDNFQDIFKDEADKKVYANLLDKYQKQYGFILHSYCLKSNFISILIELKEGLNISDIMHDLSTNYTKYFNGKYGRKGHLFKERYDLVVAEKERYIELITKHMQHTAANLDTSHYSPSPDFTRSGVIGSNEFISRVKAIVAQKEAQAKKEKKAQINRLIMRRLGLTLAGVTVILLILTAGIYNMQVERHMKEMDAYYKEFGKTLEIEKQKVRALEDKLGGGLTGERVSGLAGEQVSGLKELP